MSIEHTGIVTSVKDNTVKVKINRYNACSSCAAQAGCGLREYREKNIEIFTNNAHEFSVGQEVIINMAASLGWLAIFYAYILPLILMLATLIILLLLDSSEIIAGISAIIILIPYYLGLFLTQKKIKKQIQFQISKK